MPEARDLLGRAYLASAEEIKAITEEARAHSWSARFSERVLDERVDKRNVHLVVPFIDNGPGMSGVPSCRCSLWYKIADSRKRARVVIDVSLSRLTTLRRPTLDQLNRLVAMLIEEIEPEFLTKD
jgi:hypothetical protein